MSEPASVTKTNRDLIFLTAFLAIGMVLFELWMATTPHDNSREQHLAGAVAYARGHIDLLRPILPGFTVNGSPTPLEFPLWQAVTAAFMKCFGIWYGWGNVVSLIFFFSSLWALFDLCRRLGSARVAWWTIVFTLLQPLSLLIGGQAGGDSTAWTFAMWFVYASYRMMSEENWLWWIFAVGVGCLSAMIKAPFFASAGLVTFFWLCLRYRRSKRAWLFLASAGVLSAVALLAWNYHCHRVYAEAEFSTINLDPLDSKSTIRGWYFGSLAYRLNVHNWVRGGWHLANYVLGSLGFLFLILVTVRAKKSTEAWLWILAAFCATLMFPALVLIHTHYFFIFAPAAAWLCALGAAEIEPLIWSQLRLPILPRTVLLLVTFIVSLAGSLTLVHANAYFDPYEDRLAQLIKQHTRPEEKIVVWGRNWGSPFLRSDRQGFTGGLGLGDYDWLNDPQKIKRLKELGYTKIVLLNRSELLAAISATTGKIDYALVDLHQWIPSVAKDWPVAFDSPQILIIDIPDSVSQ